MGLSACVVNMHAGSQCVCMTPMTSSHQGSPQKWISRGVNYISKILHINIKINIKWLFKLIFAYTKVIYDDIIDIFKKKIYDSPLNVYKWNNSIEHVECKVSQSNVFAAFPVMPCCIKIILNKILMVLRKAFKSP